MIEIQKEDQGLNLIHRRVYVKPLDVFGEVVEVNQITGFYHVACEEPMPGYRYITNETKYLLFP